MAEDYGDLLAREVSQRIARPVTNEAALSSVAARDKDNGRLFLALSEGSLWLYSTADTAFKRVSGGATGFHGFSLYDFREVSSAGDVGNITANGGILASDTTPILRGDAAETQEIVWATGNADPIACHITLPPTFSGAAVATVDLWVYSGATDAASFTVETGWDGGALVSDTADDSTTKSATLHKITATVAAADIPNAARLLTLILTPPTHASDAIALLGVGLNFSHLTA